VSPAEYALVYEGVDKHFGAARALETVNLRIAAGRVTGLLGPDGAGKTTLLRLAAGLLLPDRGRIEVLGRDPLRELPALQADLGYMPQRFGLYEDLSVQENLDLYADLHGLPGSARPARCAELLQMTALAPFTRRLAGALSGGMKQKLGLACTLIGQPRLLLLDEPTVGVDPVSRRELWAILYRLVGRSGLTVLLSTAYLDEAERCAEVVLLNQGRVLAQREPADLAAMAAGRVFAVTHPALPRHEMLRRLAESRGVVDVLPRGDGARAVAEGRGGIEESLPGAVIAPIAPRLEDAFMLLLRAERSAADSGQIAIRPRDVSRSADAIVVRDLKRRFGRFYAVKGVTFTVRRGEVFGLLGANGAGKSTTFRMLCGLLPITSGQALVAGLDLARAAADARARIGYMAQRFSLYGNLSVVENLRFFSAAYGLKSEVQRERMAWALDQFDLEAYAGTNSGLLPPGYKQRLAMAAALMHEPEILFLDEPTSGVDPLARREFWLRIAALARAGVTVLVTTHFMEEAEYCDRLVIMDAGEILAEGSPDDMKALAASTTGAPSMEDAFIHLLQSRQAEAGA